MMLIEYMISGNADGDMIITKLCEQNEGNNST